MVTKMALARIGAGWMAIAGPVFAAGMFALAVAPAGAMAAVVPAESESGASSVSADYTVYIGGFKAAEGTVSATLHDDAYDLHSFLGVAGVPKNFLDAKWTMESKGRFDDARPHPGRFAFHSDQNGEIKYREMTYDAAGRPEMTFEPPLRPNEKIHVLPHERQNTLDPISALLVPVVAGNNPCDRTLAVFDGKRRYDLRLAFDREGTVTTRDKGYSGEAIRCSVQMAPRSGMRQTSFIRMLQQRDNAHIWLAPVNGGSIYIPVRIQVRTPIGGAVMDVVKLRQYAATETAAKTAAAK